METPNTIEGAITEDIMRRAVQKLGKFPTHNYNKLYEAVLEGLNHNLPAARKAPADMNGDAFSAIQDYDRKRQIRLAGGTPLGSFS